MSQIIAMSQRLQEYEQIIEALKSKLSPLTVSPTTMNETHSDLDEPENAQATYQTGNELDGDETDTVFTSASLLSDLSLDENGKVGLSPRQESPHNQGVNPVIALLLWTNVGCTLPSGIGRP